MKVLDIAKAVKPGAKYKIIGIRPGEKVHEQMIGSEDSIYTFEYKDYYKILPSLFNWSKDKKRIKNGKKVKENFVYSSNNNTKWLTIADLQNWLEDNH